MSDQPPGRKRYRAVTPVTDYSTSQKIRIALIDAGHTDLAIDSIVDPVRGLEEEVGHLKVRMTGYELERKKFVTESGVHRIINAEEIEKEFKTWRTVAKAVGKVALKWAGRIVALFIVWYAGKHGINLK